MRTYAIIEVDNGLQVVEEAPGQSAEQIAASRQGTVVDPGPYTSFDEAYDALLTLQSESEEEEAEQAD